MCVHSQFIHFKEPHDTIILFLKKKNSLNAAIPQSAKYKITSVMILSVDFISS